MPLKVPLSYSTIDEISIDHYSNVMHLRNSPDRPTHVQHESFSSDNHRGTYNGPHEQIEQKQASGPHWLGSRAAEATIKGHADFLRQSPLPRVVQEQFGHGPEEPQGGRELEKQLVHRADAL